LAPGGRTLRAVVFGGSGFIGTHVCKALHECGCTVTSISRSGLNTRGATELDGSEPTVLQRFPDAAWVSQVDWVQADTEDESALSAALEGHVDSVVSCIGSRNVLRISKDGWRNGAWSKEAEESYSQNFAPNEKAFAAARAAGATRCVYIGVSSDAEMGLSGSQPGAFKGKRDAYAAACAAFGPQAVVCFGPHSVVQRASDPRVKALDSGWARSLMALNKAVGELGYRGEDFVTRTSLTPPVPVDDLAVAVAATVTGAVEVGESERRVVTIDSRTAASGVEVRTVGRHVDGTESIKQLAGEARARLARPTNVR